MMRMADEANPHLLVVLTVTPARELPLISLCFVAVDGINIYWVMNGGPGEDGHSYLTPQIG